MISNIKKEIFDPYRKVKSVNSSKSQAKSHKRATKFGKLSKKITDKDRFCNCCNQTEYTDKFTLKDSADDFSSISPTLSIYFKFVIYLIFLLAFNFIFTGIYALINIPAIQGCFLNSCVLPMKDFDFIQARYDYKNQYFATFYQILIFVDIILMIMGKYIFYFYIRKFNFLKDEQRTTPSDYTILIKDIPKKDSADVIKKKMDMYFKKFDPSIEIEKINYLYDISEYVKTIKESLEIQKKIKIKESKNSESVSNLYAELQKKNEKLNVLKKEFGSRMENKFTGEAFVTFEKQIHMRKVVEKSRTNIFIMKLKKGEYSITRAKEPNDIIWENFGLTRGERFLKQFIVFLISFIIIGLSFLIIYGLKVLQEGKVLQYIYNIIISLVIVLINGSLRLSLSFLNNRERRTNYSFKESSLVYKKIVANFVNSGLIVLVVSLIVYRKNGNNYEDYVFSQKGMAANMYLVFIFSLVSDVIFALLSPFHLLIKIKRFIIERKLKNVGKKVILQCEVNEVFEGINFDFADKFYVLFKIVCLIFFFQTILPYGMLIGVLQIAILGLLNKKELVSFCNRPKDLNFIFSVKMINNLGLCNFLQACGFITFSKFFQDDLNIVALIAVIITAIDWLIIDIRLIDNIFKKKLKLNLKGDQGYKVENLNFPSDYDRLNPLTQERAYKNWILALKDKKDKKMTQSYMMNVNKSFLTPDEKAPDDIIVTLYNYLQANRQITFNDTGILDRVKNLQNKNDINLYSLNNILSHNQLVEDIKFNDYKDDPYTDQKINQDDIPFFPTEDIALYSDEVNDQKFDFMRSNFFFNNQQRGRDTIYDGNNNYKDIDYNEHLNDIPITSNNLKNNIDYNQPIMNVDKNNIHKYDDQRINMINNNNNNIYLPDQPLMPLEENNQKIDQKVFDLTNKNNNNAYPNFNEQGISYLYNNNNPLLRNYQDQALNKQNK